MDHVKHDRIFSLSRLHYYPGGEYLDTTFWLPPRPEDSWRADSGQAQRRVWLKVDHGRPLLRIDHTEFKAQRVCDGGQRWVDYGVVEVPLGFSQLRVQGITVAQCADAFLLIAQDPNFSPEGCTLEQAQRRLWGLARCDAGSTTLQPSVVPVGSGGAFTVRYTAGPRGLPAGAMVRFAVPKAFATPQQEDRNADGYICVDDSADGVSIVAIEDTIETHVYKDVICRLDKGLQPLASFQLRYATEHTYIFDYQYSETDRIYWYSHLPLLSAAVAVAEHSTFVSLDRANGHRLEFEPGSPETLHLFLPGRRHVSEELSLRGTFTDRYRNTPGPGLIDYDIELCLLKGAEEILLGTPAGHFRDWHRFEIPLGQLAPGVYRAVARRRGGKAIIARSNPLEIIDSDSPSELLYWGELHGHTEKSDGSGDYSELYRKARRQGCLDFAAAADHACYFSDNEWLTIQDITNSWNEPGRFVTLIGYEWAGNQVHRNIYTCRPRLQLFRGMYPPTANINVVWRHFHGDEEVVGGPHAPLAHGITWEHHDERVERFVEVYSMWGASDTREGAYVPRLAFAEGRMTVNEILQTGAKLGFTGGGDCHEGRVGFVQEDAAGQGKVPHTFSGNIPYRCGMTAALMESLDRASLIKAIRNRRTYATTGARILLDFTAAGHQMGTVGQAESVECHVLIHAVEPIILVEIVKDGQVAWQKQLHDLDAELSWHDPAGPQAEHYYYLRVTQADGHMAWSSPVWIREPVTN